MPRLFGTDGVRGVANKDLTPDLALSLGRAAGHALARGRHVVVGRDTRLSGPMIEAALVAGLCSAGADPLLAGVLPSPAIAFLTLDSNAAAGAVVSASHNPVEDNGIKFFSAEGAKLAVDVEDRIEDLMANPPELPAGTGVGRPQPLADAAERYERHLLDSLPHRLEGIKVVLDCAFGAAVGIGPRIFEHAGAEVVAINDEPDGARINVDCGSTNMDGLAARVLKEGAALGVAFDGDADRALAVDERGNPIDGDRILALLGIALHAEDLLENDVVVATVMSNLGFERALEARGIDVITAPVGDKFVVEAMVESRAVLGGEQSGHIVIGDRTTGDGILTGLHVAAAVAFSGSPLSELAHVYEPFPQVLINVRVADKDALEAAAPLWEEIRRTEEELGEAGRVLIRPSGTEPVVRVMVEHADAETANATAKRLAQAVEDHLGAG